MLSTKMYLLFLGNRGMRNDWEGGFLPSEGRSWVRQSEGMAVQGTSMRAQGTLRQQGGESGLRAAREAEWHHVERLKKEHEL